MTRFWFLAAGAGALSGLLYGIPPAGLLAGMAVAVLVPVPLFLAGLGLGAAAAIAAGAAGMVVVLVLHGLLPTAIYAAVTAIPAAVLCRQAMLSRDDGEGLEWYPSGLLVGWLTGIGLVLALPTTAMMSLASVQELFDVNLRAFAEHFAAGNADVTADQMAELLAPAKRLAPAVSTIGWTLLLLAGGAIAQAILVRSGRNLRPTPGFLDMELPGWIPVAAALAIVGAMSLPDPVGAYALSASFAAAFPFLLQGLAVVHAFSRKVGGGFALLAIFYVLVVFQGWPMLLVVLLGAVEQFAGFRRRWTKPDET